MDRGNEWYVYVLRNVKSTKVYTGCTNRPSHRLEAHCGRRSGGAKTTRAWGPDQARMFLLIGPFTETQAKSFEYTMKKTRVAQSGIRGRVAALVKLFNKPGGIISKKVRLSQCQGLTVKYEHGRERFMRMANVTQLPMCAEFQFNCGENLLRE